MIVRKTCWRRKGEQVNLKAMYPLVDILIPEKQMDIAMNPKKKNERMGDNVSVIYRK